MDLGCVSTPLASLKVPCNGHRADTLSYPPSAILPSPTPASWDPVRDRPTMRPITLSHDESRQVKYPEDEEEDTGDKKKEKKKLGFFSGKDKGRTKGKFGHDEFAGRRDEL